MTEFCKNCGKEYAGDYPCSDCGSVNFVKEEDAIKVGKEKKE